MAARDGERRISQRNGDWTTATTAIVTPQNATEYGVDFAMWFQAVNDPAYSRSIVTVNGTSQEGPVIRSVPHLDKLDRIQLTIRTYFWPPGPGSNQLTAFGEAVDLPIVPEPNTIWLLTIAAMVAGTARRRCG